MAISRMSLIGRVTPAPFRAQAGQLISQSDAQALSRSGKLVSGMKVHADGDPSRILYTTGGSNSLSGSNSSSSSSSGSWDSGSWNSGNLTDLMNLQNAQDTASMQRAFGFRTQEAEQRYGHQRGLADQGYEHQKSLNQQNFGFQTNLNRQQFENTSALSAQDYTQTKDLNLQRFTHEADTDKRRQAHQLATMHLENQLDDQDWRRNRSAAHSTFFKTNR